MAGVERRAGRGDVVHEQDMAADDGVSFANSESVGDVLKTRFASQLRLAWRIGYPNEGSRLEARVRFPGHRPREERRLVVSTLR